VPFSVLMSIYAKEKPEYFELALESVCTQTVVPDEIVIVQDGEITSGLHYICNKYKQRYPNKFCIVSLKTNQGLGVALQEGVKACSYELIARMDTDDIAKPDRFERQLAEFEKNPELSLCGGYIAEFSTTLEKINSTRKVPLSYREIYEYAKQRNPFNHMTVMFKKKDILAVGNYQPFHLNEDYYLWFRVLQAGYKVKNISAVLVFARADQKMIARRGGMEYLLQEIKLQKIFLKAGYISYFSYVKNIGIRGTFRILPVPIRHILYKVCLR
jgi:Glycosyltransferases, probably involved in cell wall biogenesis